MWIFRGSTDIPPTPTPDPIVGCMVPYATNYNPNANIQGLCTFPDNSLRHQIVEGSEALIEGHGIYVLEALNQGYGSSLTALTDITGKGITYGFQIAQDTGYELLIYSYQGAGNLVPTFTELYPDIQGFMPLGSNNFEELATPTSIPVMVTCGAGATENITGYGMGLEFFDNESIGSGAIQSSLSTGIIAGKIMRIKDTCNCTWWQARLRARITADRTLHTHPNGEYWNKYNGFGIINVANAIAYNGALIADPYLNNGNTYFPFLP